MRGRPVGGSRRLLRAAALRCWAALAAMLLLAAVGRAAEGSLTLLSEPGAEILWEGISLGTVDREGRLVIDEIPPGAYSILVRKPGFEERSERVEIGTGEHTVRLPLHAVASVPGPARVRREEGRPEPSRPVDRPLEGPGPVDREAETTAVAEGAGGEVEAVEEAEPAGAAAAGAAEREAAGGEPAQVATPGVPDTEEGGLTPVLLVGALAVVALAAAGLVLAPRRSRRRHRATPSTAAAGRVEDAVVTPRRIMASGGPAFLGELRQRERSLGGLRGYAPEKEEPKVIDIELADDSFEEGEER